jgi:hypothetical protein
MQGRGDFNRAFSQFYGLWASIRIYVCAFNHTIIQQVKVSPLPVDKVSRLISKKRLYER